MYGVLEIYILGYKSLHLQGSAKVRQYWRVKLHAGGLQKKSVQEETWRAKPILRELEFSTLSWRLPFRLRPGNVDLLAIDTFASRLYGLDLGTPKGYTCQFISVGASRLRLLGSLISNIS
jgi:hypothetical protein